MQRGGAGEDTSKLRIVLKRTSSRPTTTTMMQRLTDGNSRSGLGLDAANILPILSDELASCIHVTRWELERTRRWSRIRIHSRHFPERLPWDTTKVVVSECRGNRGAILCMCVVRRRNNIHCDERGRVWNEEARGCTYLLHVFKNVRSPQASFVESTRDQLHTNATYASHVAHMFRESFSKAAASL